MIHAEKIRRDLVGAVAEAAAASPDVRTVMGALLGAIGLTPFNSHNLAGREHTLVKALRTSGVRMIVIDELHHMLAAHGRQQRQLLNLLRWLGNELQIPLVCIGTRDAYPALRTDDQRPARQFRAGRSPSGLPILGAPALSAITLLKTDGIICEVATLLGRAAVHAIRTGAERRESSTLWPSVTEWAASPDGAGAQVKSHN